MLVDDTATSLDQRYSYLAGRRKWLQGLISANDGLAMAALIEYMSALSDFHAVGESENAAAVSSHLLRISRGSASSARPGTTS